MGNWGGGHHTPVHALETLGLWACRNSGCPKPAQPVLDWNVPRVPGRSLCPAGQSGRRRLSLPLGWKALGGGGLQGWAKAGRGGIREYLKEMRLDVSSEPELETEVLRFCPEGNGEP